MSYYIRTLQQSRPSTSKENLMNRNIQLHSHEFFSLIELP